MSVDGEAPSAVGAGRREWLGLAALVLAVALLASDSTVLSLGVPSLSADLAPSPTQLLWIADVYSFALAGLLVTMGNLGDRIGRKRLLLLGAAGFGLASLLAAFAPTAGWLITARVLLGVAGATLMPSTLSIIRNLFLDGRQRSTAIAIWAAAATVGAAVGPLVGGLLLEHFWWGAVFLINLPVMAVLLAVGPVLLPESRNPRPSAFDLPGNDTPSPPTRAARDVLESGHDDEELEMTDSTGVSPYMQRETFDPPQEIALARDTEGIAHVAMPYGSAQAGYAVSRHQDVREVLSDSTRFRIAPSEYGDLTEDEAAQLRAGQLLEFDPPEHTRLRRLLTPEFTMRRMRRLEPRIVDIVESALDDVENAGSPVDLVETFALPVPSLVICELLGVPYSDRDEFQARSHDMVDASLSPEQQTEVARQDHAYMARLVHRAQTDPGEDILGMLVREHAAELSTAELTGIASLLLVAGHETTANMLALGTLALLRHPEQLSIMRDEPAEVGAAVEELLRWLSVVPSGAVRTTTADVEIAGRVIPAGEQIMVALPAANRDPAYIDQPDCLDVRRGAPGHLAFGHGVHHCLGAPLARMEMRIAFPALLRRFPTLRLAVPFEEIRFRANHLVYGLHALPVTW